MKDGAGQAVDCYVRQLLVAIAAAFRSLLKSSHSGAEQLASKLWFVLKELRHDILSRVLRRAK